MVRASSSGSISLKHSAFEGNTELEQGGIRGAVVQTYSTEAAASLVRIESCQFMVEIEDSLIFHQVFQVSSGSSVGPVVSCFSDFALPVAETVSYLPGSCTEQRPSIAALPLSNTSTLPEGTFENLTESRIRGIQQVCSKNVKHSESSWCSSCFIHSALYNSFRLLFEQYYTRAESRGFVLLLNVDTSIL